MAAVEHFKLQFSAVPCVDQSHLLDCIPPLISQQINDTLLADPSLLEVHQAILSIPKEAAVGPDGFSGSFFTGCWSIIVDDILKAVTFVFHGGAIPRAVNASLICLILKSPAPRSFSDFRPISLCNCFYKINARVIASRLNAILPSLISPVQGAFIQDRPISENIALAQELFRDINRKTRGGNLVLKIYMEKAYDRIDWGFLKSVMARFRFNQRGLRQGDPLSPALFIIGAKVLSRGLNRLLSHHQVLPFKLGKGCPPISHLLYTDDTLLFLNGSISSIKATKKFLDDYQQTLRQSINHRKSYFICLKSTSLARSRLIERTLNIAKSEGPLTYLGVSIAAGRLKCSAFQPLLDKVKGRIMGWQARFLSQVGRTVLIKHVLGSIHVHSLATAHLPSQVLASLESCFANFLWGWAGGKNKLHWRSWKAVSLAKEEDGLGIRKLVDIMTSFRLKMAWDIRHKED
ncbi:uncharacterized protein LOC131255315 [Magnolia sinica]|uniref:uncharacterized protein LOC131255315 n=1 Tax=Magnolia sinica TaxID=86752 RepID=UPI00265A0C8C|nr:uncharacterized protein LOC131255315 [Magnolia sinica]